MADREREWRRIRPRFESMLFRAGYREAARRMAVSVSTVYRIACQNTIPQPRTIRDIEIAVREFEGEQEGFSHTEQPPNL